LQRHWVHIHVNEIQNKHKSPSVLYRARPRYERQGGGQGDEVCKLALHICSRNMWRGSCIYFLFLASGVVAAPCRVIVHDDDDNTQEDVFMVLQHLGLTPSHAQRTVDQIMRRGEAVVLESQDARACSDAVSSLTHFGLTASSDSGPGTVRVDPNFIGDLVRSL
jgi:ATP-dependent Clp protease adapter protein ClpS